ncbi:MAG TPA: PAS domain-containing protein [Aeromicrobium sp.]|nr:PAS domain-containing protein [Aeromicrobium sp.]
MVEVHAAAAAIALIAMLFVPVRKHPPARSIAGFCFSAAVWSAAAAVAEANPGVNSASTTANTVMLAAASACAACALVSARRLVSGHWRVPLPLLIVMVSEPIAISLVRSQVLAELTSAQFRQTWWFIAHAAYCFALLVAVSLTVNVRQRDPSRRVRTFVFASQVLVISVIALEFSGSEMANLVVVVGAVFTVWIGRHPEDWATSSARGDSLLNSIGVFLFVFDHDGKLQDWNGNANRLLELITGDRPSRGMPAESILGRALPFADGQPIDLAMEGGKIRTSAHIHKVDPLSRTENQSWVVMLRPVRSSVDRESFPAVSGELDGHDPSTQTLGRKATIKLLKDAVPVGNVAVRIDISPTSAEAREDEVMFVIARRLKSLFPDTQWGRLSTWVFVGVFEPAAAVRAKQVIDLEASAAIGLAVTAESTVCTPRASEPAEAFARRVGLGRAIPSSATHD